MAHVVDSQHGGERGPVVTVKDTSAEKLDKPWPIGVSIVVCSDMKADPASAMSHILFESGTLLLFMGKIIEPEDELIPGEVRDR
jgi:hypothetical protein